MSIRQQRMAARIRTILGGLLLREVADPRLQGLTVTDLRLDPELLFADVWVNALGEEERRAEVMAALARANAFLRRQVGRRVRLRVVPELHFHWDDLPETGARMEQLIDSLEIPPGEATEDDEPRA